MEDTKITFPSEILLLILDCIYGGARYTKKTKKTQVIMPLFLVCKQWQCLAESIVYRNMYFEYVMYAEQSLLERKVRRSLRSDILRLSYIRHLHLSLCKGAGEEDFMVLYLRHMTGLKTVKLDSPGRYDTHSWSEPAIFSILTRRPIEKLEVSGTWTGPTFAQLSTPLSEQIFSSLKHLTIQSGDRSMDGFTLPLHRYGTSCLESLKIDHVPSMEVVKELMRWPLALREIILPWEHPVRISNSSMQEILEIQSPSLGKIVLCYLYDVSTPASNIFPDLSHFPRLARLSGNWRSFVKQEPDVVVGQLSGLKFTTLTIDMRYYREEWPHHVGFSPRHGNWLLDFAASYRRLRPAGPLENIVVDFGLLDYHERDAINGMGSSEAWDNLMAVKSGLSELGFKLSVEPTLAEMDWLDILDAQC